MAEEDALPNSEETQNLFKHLQGEVTPEQFQAWNELNTQISNFIVQKTTPTKSSSESELLFSPNVLTDQSVLYLQDDDNEAQANNLSVSYVWNILDPNDPGRMEEEDDNKEEADDSVLDLADATSRVSALSKLQASAQSPADDDFSTIALNTPEVLAKYLTGKMTFEEFYEKMSEVRKNKERGKRTRKRKIDHDFTYEEDDDEIDDAEEYSDTSRDDSWKPASEKTVESEPKKKKMKKPRRKQWQLPKSLRGLMGETHKQVAMNRFDDAIGMCLELIRQAPHASEPYDTLGHIFDEQEDTTKAIEFYLMSAYLKRVDTDLWVSLANRLLKLGENNKALQCFSQAIKFATTNKLELMQERSRLYEQMGEMSRALMGYTQILNYIEPSSENDEKYLRLARKVCEKYHSMKRTNDAARVLATMFKTRPSLINSEDVNKLLDLRMTMKQYQACLEGLVDYCGVEATLSNGREWSQSTPLPGDLDIKTQPGIITSVRVPGNLPQGFPLELLTKLCACLIYLGFSQQAKHLVAVLLKENVEENGNGDRFLDVAEAYMDTEQYEEALPILSRCVDSQEYSQAAVWLLYGECLRSSGRLPEAVEAFSKVVHLAPNHLGARVSLSALQQQIGRHDEALQVLSGEGLGDESRSILEDQTLLLHKCHLLFSQKRNSQFLAASRRLLFHYFHEMYKPAYMKIIFSGRSLRHRLEAFRTYLTAQKDSDNERETETRKNRSTDEQQKISSNELWDLYLKLCDVLLEEEKWEDLTEVTLLGLTCPAFNADPVKVKDAEFLCLTACLMTNNSQFAYHFIKDICIKEPNNAMAWNLFNQSILHSTESPDHLGLSLLTGHNSLQNGNYKTALGQYVEVFRRSPADPLVNLCIGLCYIHLACQKWVRRRNWIILQGIAFLNSYLNLRGQCQEAYYNIGRAMHQLNLSYAAVYYYKQALSLPPVVSDKDGSLDLRREIAFNLSLIYKKSGNLDLARLITRTYIIV